MTKTQIDKLGERLKKGDITEADLRLLDSYRRSFAEAYEHVVAILRNDLRLHPTGRPTKSTLSISEKLRRESIRLTQIQDIAGCRVVVRDAPTQNRVFRRIMRAFPDAQIIDRRLVPSHGYRAIHILVAASGKIVELQLRTEPQHLWAQFSEKLSDIFDPSIKYGGGTPMIRQVLDAMSENVAHGEVAEVRLHDALNAIKRVERTKPNREQRAKLIKLRAGLGRIRAKLRRYRKTMLATFREALRTKWTADR